MTAESPVYYSCPVTFVMPKLSQKLLIPISSFPAAAAAGGGDEGAFNSARLSIIIVICC